MVEYLWPMVPWPKLKLILMFWKSCLSWRVLNTVLPGLFSTEHPLFPMKPLTNFRQ